MFAQRYLCKDHMVRKCLDDLHVVHKLDFLVLLEDLPLSVLVAHLSKFVLQSLNISDEAYLSASLPHMLKLLAS